MANTKKEIPNDRMAKYLASHDFKLLKKQKKLLIKIQVKMEKDPGFTQNEWDAIEGMLNWIDSVQDIAVDEYGYAEKKIFNLSK